MTENIELDLNMDPRVVEDLNRSRGLMIDYKGERIHWGELVFMAILGIFMGGIGVVIAPLFVWLLRRYGWAEKFWSKFGINSD